MDSLNKERLLSKFYELCPEIEQLGIQPIILNRGSRY